MGLNTESTYEDLLQHVLEHGEERMDRTGTGTLNVFGAQLRFNLLGQFPLITSKRVFWRGVVEELLWFIRGSTNNNELVERNVHIWDEWAREDGELGPIYGRQWRSWGAGFGYERTPNEVQIHDRKIDQLRDVIEQIKTNPMSRRLIVSAWNVGELPQMALPPCHALFQFDVSRDGRLNCQLYQRSADLFLGVPFNIASYALLTRMIAKECGLLPGEFVHTFGSAHIYLNHVDQVVEQLSREPRPFPELVIDYPEGTSVFDMTEFDRFRLEGYKPHPAIKAPVAV